MTHDKLIEDAARAIAADLGNQDMGKPFQLDGNLMLDYIDQGTTDFRSLATAALAPALALLDAKDAALRSIAEGNLGESPWQASYARVQEIARAALTPQEQTKA